MPRQMIEGGDMGQHYLIYMLSRCFFVFFFVLALVFFLTWRVAESNAGADNSMPEIGART